jgi:hypothetical protein
MVDEVIGEVSPVKGPCGMIKAREILCSIPEIAPNKVYSA